MTILSAQMTFLLIHFIKIGLVTVSRAGRSPAKNILVKKNFLVKKCFLVVRALTRARTRARTRTHMHTCVRTQASFQDEL